jgi:Tfp pilus assembly protein PilF
MKGSAAFLLLIGLCASAPARSADPVPEDARRHVVRGHTAVEMAKSPKDYRAAIEEFERAVRIAPQWADAYYNLGMVQSRAGRSREAIVNLKRYLELAPNAADAAQVRDEIVALEYRLEREAQFEELQGGGWLVGEPSGLLPPVGPAYEFRLEGDRIVLQRSLEAGIGTDEVVVDTLGGLAPFERYAKGRFSERFELQRDGLALHGQYVRSAYQEEKSGCTIPEDRTDARGRLDPQRKRIELQYRRQYYRARYASSPFSTSCSGVVPLRSEERSEVLVRQPGPQPQGAVGVRIEQDSGGAVIVREVVARSPAERAGLRAGDRLIAIDGKEVAGLTLPQVAQRLRGAPATTVTIQVLRAGNAEPLVVAVTRSGEPKAAGAR